MPLEERRVHLARAHGAVTLPADCIVVAAMNPCPCGMAGDPDRECTCPPARRAAYAARISGPLLDRFDLRVEAPRAAAHAAGGEASAVVRARVVAARAALAAGPLEVDAAASALLDRAVARPLPVGAGSRPRAPCGGDDRGARRPRPGRRGAHGRGALASGERPDERARRSCGWSRRLREPVSTPVRSSGVSGGADQLLQASAKRLDALGVVPGLARELAAARTARTSPPTQPTWPRGDRVHRPLRPGISGAVARAGRSAAGGVCDGRRGGAAAGCSWAGARHRRARGGPERRRSRWRAGWRHSRPARGCASSAGWRSAWTRPATSARSMSDGGTIAVLGCGPDVAYPRTNAGLLPPHRRDRARTVGVRAGHTARPVAVPLSGEPGRLAAGRIGLEGV